VLENPDHAGVQAVVRDLNAAYVAEPALWEVDFSHEGFRWLEPNAAADNSLAFARVSADGERWLVCIANLSPVVREEWRVGLPVGGRWREVVNTDSRFYGGSDVGNGWGVEADGEPWMEQPSSALVTLPPLATIWLAPDAQRP